MAAWLVLLVSVPPHPSSLRVRVWRKLRALGAVALKKSVYILPFTPESAGLYAAATGFQAISKDDHENMARQFPLYDALYAYCRAKGRVERAG